MFFCWRQLCKYICHYFHLGILSPYVRIQKTNNVMFFFLLIIFFQKSKIRNKFFVKCRRRLLMKKSMELDERKPKNKEIVLLRRLWKNVCHYFQLGILSRYILSCHIRYIRIINLSKSKIRELFFVISYVFVHLTPITQSSKIKSLIQTHS